MQLTQITADTQTKCRRLRLPILLALFFSLTLYIIVRFIYNEIYVFHQIQTVTQAEQKKQVSSPVVKSGALLVTGKVGHSFFHTAIQAGLSIEEVKAVFQLTDGLFDLVDDLQADGIFGVLVKHTRIPKQNPIAFYYRDQDAELYIYRSAKNVLFNKSGQDISHRITLSRPLKSFYPISSPFNEMRLHPILHKYMPHYGTDYATPLKTKVFSAAPGVVIESRYNMLSGNYVVIRHSNKLTTKYLHLSKRLVTVGTHVKQHQLIGFTGNTGRTTGPHLHFELLVHGQPVNFETFYRQQNQHPSYQRTTQNQAAIDAFQQLEHMVMKQREQ